MKNHKKIITIAASVLVIAGGVFIGANIATHNNNIKTITKAATMNNKESVSVITTQAETTTVQPTTVEETTTRAVKIIKNIKLNKTKARLIKGKKLKLKATVSYKKSKAKSFEKPVWTTSNSNIATVTHDGKVKALSKGKVLIICRNESRTVEAKCKITIINPYRSIKEITLDKDAMRMNPGDSRALSFTAKYKGKKSYDTEPVIWKSSNKKIATVNKKGIVKGKSNGKAYITVKGKYSKKSVKCKVTVKDTKYIAFTFDDGPGIYTDKLLDALNKYHSKATFFVLGDHAEPFKDVLNREYKYGMEIGSHTYSHQNLNAISKKEVISEIKKHAKQFLMQQDIIRHYFARLMVISIKQ